MSRSTEWKYQGARPRQFGTDVHCRFPPLIVLRNPYAAHPVPGFFAYFYPQGKLQTHVPLRSVCKLRLKKLDFGASYSQTGPVQQLQNIRSMRSRSRRFILWFFGLYAINDDGTVVTGGNDVGAAGSLAVLLDRIRTFPLLSAFRR